MTQLEAVGWVRVQKKESEELTELDIDEIFKMIDVDKSGSISRSVSLCEGSTRLVKPILEGGKTCIQASDKKIWHQRRKITYEYIVIQLSFKFNIGWFMD